MCPHLQPSTCKPHANASPATHATAPKGARDDYDAFITSVRDLIGGDPSSDELAEAGAGVWAALGGDSSGLEPPDEIKLHKPGPLLVRDLFAVGRHSAGRAAARGKQFTPLLSPVFLTKTPTLISQARQLVPNEAALRAALPHIELPALPASLTACAHLPPPPHSP